MVDGKAKTTIAICMTLVAIFALFSWCGVREKNATYDEVVHAPSAWIFARYHDFRIDPEAPPLWKYWASVPHWVAPPVVDRHSTAWRAMLQEPLAQWRFAVETLYRTPGNDADNFVNRSRAMMLVAALSLGAVTAWWGWQIGGAVAAVVTTMLFGFDPNFLAHAPLVKNDVVLALVFFALAFSVWRLGMKATWPGVAGLAVLCAAGPCIKFSGLIAPPLVLVLLIARALLPEPWMFLGRHLQDRLTRLLASVALFVPVALACFLAVWASYGFRHAATPEPGVQLNSEHLVILTAINERLANHPEQPVLEQELRDWEPGLLVRSVIFAGRHHLLPEAWLYGLLYTHMTTRLNNGFLCGEHSPIGWWYYFPLAMVFKTPVATLLGIVLALVILVLCRSKAAISKYPLSPWLAICLLFPLTIYGGFSLKSNVNLGLRYILPLYPFLFLIVGLAAARAWDVWGKKAVVPTAVLLAGLAFETTAVFPNYLTFFNKISGGPRQGLQLLGDSNLDWGQGLKSLARWTAENPHQQIYLCYFGMADPAYYGIDYVNLPGGYRYGPDFQLPKEDGIVAISATHLQGIHLTAELRQFYAPLRTARPMTVLDNSIYLFDAANLTPGGQQ